MKNICSHGLGLCDRLIKWEFHFKLLPNAFHFDDSNNTAADVFGEVFPGSQMGHIPHNDHNYGDLDKLGIQPDIIRTCVALFWSNYIYYYIQSTIFYQVRNRDRAFSPEKKLHIIYRVDIPRQAGSISRHERYHSQNTLPPR